MRESDEALMVRGDEDAFDTLLGRYRGDLVRFCHSFIRNDETAEELAQDTMLRVYLNAGRFDPSRNFKAWLLRIAANTCRSEIRRRRIHKEESDTTELLDILPAKPHDPQREMDTRAQLKSLREAVKVLPKHQRDTLALEGQGKLTRREIAEFFGVTKSAIKLRMHCAREALRVMLRKE